MSIRSSNAVFEKVVFLFTMYSIKRNEQSKNKSDEERRFVHVASRKQLHWSNWRDNRQFIASVGPLFTCPHIKDVLGRHPISAPEIARAWPFGASATVTV